MRSLCSGWGIQMGGAGLQPGSSPPRIPVWGYKPANPCELGNGSLPPSLAQPVLYGSHGSCGPWIAAGLAAIGHPGLSGRFACCPASLHAFLFTSPQREGQPDACTPRLQRQALGAGWLATVLVLGGSACWGPGCCSLEPAAGLWALGARSGGSRWTVKSRSVSASRLPVTPPLLPAPPVLRQEPTLGFPKGWSFSCWRGDSWSSYILLSGRHPGRGVLTQAAWPPRLPA